MVNVKWKHHLWWRYNWRGSPWPTIWLYMLCRRVLHLYKKNICLMYNYRVYKNLFWIFHIQMEYPSAKHVQGVPKKHGNSVTNSISSFLWISIVTSNFKSQNIIMSARVYFMKKVKDYKDVSIMSPQDEQWIRTSLLCLYIVIFLFY